MYLSRSEPLGPHKSAIRHLLDARGEEQIFSQLRFALWRVALHRLQIRQMLLREAPERHELTLLSRLNADLPDVHISLDAQRVIDFSHAAREITEGKESPDVSRGEALGRAQQLLHAMTDLIKSMGKFVWDLTASWEQKSVRLASNDDVQSLEDLSQLSSPDPTQPRDVEYRDTSLSVMLSFHAASQIILRECCIELIHFCARFQEPEMKDLERIQDEQNAITRLSRAIFRSYSMLWDSKDEPQPKANLLHSGRMIGRSYSLFTMSVIQKASFVSSECRNRASETIAMIHANHELS